MIREVEPMALIDLVIVLVIVGVLLWLANTYIPMDPTVKRIMNIAVVVFIVIWLLQVLGLIGSLRAIRIS